MEDALAAAARQLGNGLQVKSAQRVRRGGVLGFFAKEHYEVVAEPSGETLVTAAPHQLGAASLAPATAPASDNVDRVLRSLVEEVEAREVAPMISPAPVRFTDADLVRLDPPTPTATLPDIDIEQDIERPIEQDIERPIERPLRARPIKETVAAEAPPAPEAAAPTADAIDLRTAESPTFYDFEILDAQEIERAPKWTRTALRDLGLPLPVLKALPQRTPTTDIAWTQALERAIAKVVPAPAPLDEEHDAQVSGFGGKGAVNIIRAAMSGFTPGLLQIDGRSVPATAGELALAVRSCLRR